MDFDLDELVDGITEVFAERAATKGVKFRAIIYPDVYRHLHGDAMRLRGQGVVGLERTARKTGAERFDDDGAKPLRREQRNDLPKRERRAEQSGDDGDGFAGAGPGLDVDRLRRCHDDVRMLQRRH